MINTNYIKLLRKVAIMTFLTYLIFISSEQYIFSQRISNDRPPLRERIFFGGDFGLQFGTITNIEVAPIVGLWVLPRVAIAAGPEYKYYAEKHIGSTSIFGGRAYTQLVLIQDVNNIIPAGIHLGLFFHAEDELQSLESDTPFWTNSQVETERFNINAFLIGGGISQPMGRRSALNIIALWALNDSYGIYSSPEIRISFTF